ncbi:inactive ubiquitin carboxyl-terminal hydrolase MINDY-4B-like isoform X3 [Mya arenaria]|uniref:inactive ubiquitin carboxyl-terminal hydrolase MINDY-4B-like isoform X3 n=1 Tax=Mya arenaria TaxID=6604 RepID=UPI0022E98F0E|nr:inactive ubiquitin carboxyl-terminal hydrolase MINDY-4B-like isoform X3 [Mya arenaria]
MSETESAAGGQQPATDRDNLDRLLRIFNGGTGVSMGDKLVRAIEAQAVYDSTQETQYECELADIILAAFKGCRFRSLPETKIRLEEAKRKVTINDPTPPPTTRLPQRVKTFYMDPTMDMSSRREEKPSWNHYTIIIPNLTTKSARARSMIGGTPITKETAIALRKITVGSTVHSFSRDWRKAALVFQDESTKYPWGLQTHRNGARAFILCFQAYLMKHLLFGKNYISSFATRNALKPSDFERRKALSSAICEILWQAGSQTRCCLCLQQDTAFFDTDYTYRLDGVTEKINLYDFKKYSDLEMFVKRHLSHFEHENSNGCILLLYSVILSRTIPKIFEDLGVVEHQDRFKFLSDNEECLPGLMNLVITGRATQFYHNGNIIYDRDGNLLPQPLKGMRERSNVGLLFWDKKEDDDERTEIGSMLKTPKSPIWLTLLNGQWGLLFSNNLDLVSDWRVEHHFDLYYYTGLIQNTYAIITIDTRFTRRFRVKTAVARKREQEKIPPLEQAILSKWYGANVDWNGIYPFV